MKIPEHFLGGCEDILPHCSDPKCPNIAKRATTGRYFITMGHAGFNSRTNNEFGFSNADKARATSLGYLSRSTK